MNLKFLIVFLLTGLNACFLYVSGQDIATPLKDSINNISNEDSIINYNNLLTIVYDIKVTTDKSKAGIEETYNGGIKTIFVNNDKARIRLVSLMRIQSIFFSSVKSSHPISVVKESGKKRYKYYLTNTQWDLYNSKYAQDSCQFTNDSATILNYACRKAIIVLKDGRTLVAYYTNMLKPLNRKIEPAFDRIPGLVLQYEYQYKKNKMVYTASKVSQDPIASDIFKMPARGYIVKKYCSKFRIKQTNVSEETL
jgi:GLPGLI family protein